MQKFIQFIASWDTQISLLPEHHVLFDLIQLYWMKIIL